MPSGSEEHQAHCEPEASLPSVTLRDVEEAARRLEGHVRVTPLLFPEPGERPAVAVKLECLQIAGSFKIRGATNRLLFDVGRHERIVAASGGNHGIAVATACRRLGLCADIFVPATSPAHKLEAIKAAGATVHILDGPFTEVAARCADFADAHEALLIHPFDDPMVIAGQGTVGLELLEQWPGVTTIVAAVGGGGFAAGLVVAVAGHAEIVAAEPTLCPTLVEALAAGGPVPVGVGGVAVDSLGAPQLGMLAYRLLAPALRRVVTVSERDILAAQEWWWRACRLPLEPAAACAWAAARSDQALVGPDDCIAVIACGGNSDLVEIVEPAA
jgi:threonine dehydratase